jgi:hypothetical protein
VPASGQRLAARRPTKSEFLRAQGRGVLACDVFTVETVFLINWRGGDERSDVATEPFGGARDLRLGGRR